MAEIKASLVKQLREMTGSGMMDCKRALQETDGDLEKASQYLREKGMADSVKKAGRIAAEGLVVSYIHMGGKIGVLLELNCETDFVAKTDRFKQLAMDLAMQVAASNPKYVKKEEVPAADLEKEKEILTAQARNEGKPEKIIEKMVEGRIEKYYKEVCLLEQPFIKSEDESVGDLIKQAIAEIGENITVRRFVRYEMGEGLEKRQDDFAAEVAAQLKG